MLKKWEFLLLTALAAVLLVLAVSNASLFTSNRTVQADVQTRAQYIQQTVGLENLLREIVRGLAELSVKNDDKQLRELLSAQGISINVNAPAPGAAPAAAPMPAPMAPPAKGK